MFWIIINCYYILKGKDGLLSRGACLRRPYLDISNILLSMVCMHASARVDRHGQDIINGKENRAGFD